MTQLRMPRSAHKHYPCGLVVKGRRSETINREVEVGGKLISDGCATVGAYDEGVCHDG